MRKPKAILRDFAETTSIYGFLQIVNSKNAFQRLFWIILVICCNIYLILNIDMFIRSYELKTISNKLSLKQDTTPVFPVVVLCNVNIIRNDKIVELLNEIETINRMKGQNSTAKIDFEAITAIHMTIENRIFEYGTMFDDFFISCKLFAAKNCKMENYWTKFWHPQYGTCFAFNDPFEQKGSQKQLVKVPNVGILGSLEVVLNISQNLYYHPLVHDAGAKLFIGTQGAFYDIQTKGYNLAPGFSHALSIRKKEIYRADPHQNKACVEDYSFRFPAQAPQYITKYNIEMCAYFCLATEVMESCNCTYFDTQHFYPNASICDDSSSTCLENIQDMYFRREIDCIKKCQPPCQEKIYLTDLTSLEFPNLVSKNNYGKPDIDKNLMKISIFFNSINVEVWEEMVLYKWENLLADIGGQLGLLSGISVISCFELLVLFFSFAKYCLRRSPKSKKDVNSSNQNNNAII